MTNIPKSEEITKSQYKRWALQYARLSTPIVYKEEYPSLPKTIVSNFFDLDTKGIGELWTVVEYIGNGQYIDLITEEIYTTQILENNILDTVTEEYNEEALEIQNILLANPLAIGTASDSGFCEGMRELTPEIQELILSETIPREKEIKKALEEMKQEAIDKIKLYYLGKNVYATIKNEKAAAEKKQSQQNGNLIINPTPEELERQAKLKAVIEPKFESIFPEDLAVKILSRKNKD